jgi:hypothetical protein
MSKGHWMEDVDIVELMESSDEHKEQIKESSAVTTRRANAKHYLESEEAKSKEVTRAIQLVGSFSARDSELYDGIAAIKYHASNMIRNERLDFSAPFRLATLSTISDIFRPDSSLEHPYHLFPKSYNCPALLWSWIKQDSSVLATATSWAMGWAEDGPTLKWLCLWVCDEITPREMNGTKKSLGFTLDHEVKDFELNQEEVAGKLAMMASIQKNRKIKSTNSGKKISLVLYDSS